MALNQGIGFLGRVPIDTVLVGLLDSVSKGEVKATGPGLNGHMDGGLEGLDIHGKNGGEEVDSEGEEIFPLLEAYGKTASSKVWRGITNGVVRGIDRRREENLERLKGV